MKFCGLLILIFGLLIAFSFLTDYLRVRKLVKQRNGETFYHFAAHFIGEDVPKEILINTYEYFHDWSNTIKIPVRATDDIDEIYGITDEDLDDAIEAILAKSGRRLPNPEELENMPVFNTVEDVVFFVHSSPKSDKNPKS